MREGEAGFRPRREENHCSDVTKDRVLDDLLHLREKLIGTHPAHGSQVEFGDKERPQKPRERFVDSIRWRR